MKRIFTSIALFTFALSASSFLIFYVQRSSRPIVFCTSIDDSIRPRNYCIMNPFRNTQPEVLAEIILQELKNSNTDAILPYLSKLSEDQRNHILDNEKNYKVNTWRIGGIEESKNHLSLRYWVSRQNYDGHLENISFSFEQDGDDWKLMEFDAIY